MINITFDEFNKLEFKLYGKNPIIKNPLSSFVIADPSVITPDVSHDNKFHLFCHTFFGVYMYDSNGMLYAFKYNGDVFYYVRDALGNINHIVNQDGNYQDLYLIDGINRENIVKYKKRWLYGKKNRWYT